MESWPALQHGRRPRQLDSLSRKAIGRLYETWSDDDFVLTTTRKMAGIHTIPPRDSPAVAVAGARRRPPACRCRDFVVLQPDVGVYVCPRHFRVHRCGEEWFRRCPRLLGLDPSTIDCPRAQGGSSSSTDGADCCLHTGRVLEEVEFAKTENLTTTAEMHFAVYGSSLYFGGRRGATGRGCGGGGSGNAWGSVRSRARPRVVGPCAVVSNGGARRRRTSRDGDAKLAERDRLLRATIRRVVEQFSDDANRRRYNELVDSRKGKDERTGSGSSGNSTDKKERSTSAARAREGDDDGSSSSGGGGGGGFGRVRLSVGRITPGIRSMLEAHVRVVCERLLTGVPRRDALPLESVAFCALTKAATGVRCGDRVVLPPVPFVGLLPLPSERDLRVAFGLPLKKYSRVCEAMHLALGAERASERPTQTTMPTSKREDATSDGSRDEKPDTGKRKVARVKALPAADSRWPIVETTDRLLDDMAVSTRTATALPLPPSLLPPPLPFSPLPTLSSRDRRRESR